MNIRQTVAVVLSHLTSERAADVLALLPPQFQGEVTLRLVHLDETHPDVLADIERGMQSWILEQSRALGGAQAGLSTLRGIWPLQPAEPNKTFCIVWLCEINGWPTNSRPFPAHAYVRRRRAARRPNAGQPASPGV